MQARAIPAELQKLISDLMALPAMDKGTMGGKCIPQTLAMEDFMMEEVGMKPLNGKYFVQGVKAFELKTPIKDFPPDKEMVFKGSGQDGRPAFFKASVAEILEWQTSFRTYYAPRKHCSSDVRNTEASDVYVDEEGKDLLSRSLQGHSED
ncbi:unnamed protein product [Effrenium voratum]|uniref:Uncharacterized protein n=1 Tax=Effrenium voratum TaxID=2562239 RepID=A0AA36IH63_9DINO|nr:unnamed protein product [Effrenium voratum]